MWRTHSCASRAPATAGALSRPSSDTKDSHRLEAFNVQSIRDDFLRLVLRSERTFRAHGQLDVHHIIGRQAVVSTEFLNRSVHQLRRSIVEARDQRRKITKEGLRLIWRNPPPPLSDQQ